jgi:hypothetical protein
MHPHFCTLAGFVDTDTSTNPSQRREGLKTSAAMFRFRHWDVELISSGSTASTKEGLNNAKFRRVQPNRPRSPETASAIN